MLQIKQELILHLLACHWMQKAEFSCVRTQALGHLHKFLCNLSILCSLGLTQRGIFQQTLSLELPFRSHQFFVLYINYLSILLLTLF